MADDQPSQTERDIAITVVIQTPEGRFSRTFTAEWWWRHDHDMRRREYLGGLLHRVVREAHRWVEAHIADPDEVGDTPSARPVAQRSASDVPETRQAGVCPDEADGGAPGGSAPGLALG